MSEPHIRIDEVSFTVNGHHIADCDDLDLTEPVTAGGTIDIELGPDEWARFTEHMVFSREPGEP